jgi:5-methylcytosine-specific restriction protein A
MAQENYNENESMKGTSLEKEYDATFDADEKINNLLKLSSSSFTRYFQPKLKLDEIGLTDPVKRGRLKTLRGLTTTVKDLGVINPIHVLKLEVEDEDDEIKYILLDGFRRMYGARRNGQEEIDAIVWDFEDKEQGVDLALFLGLLLNKRQKHTWSEIWDLYQILEAQSDITPGTLESLLQLESGEAMKLKDVMLCNPNHDDKYQEVIDNLLMDKKSLDGCYKMLQKLRKDEDVLDKEDEQGVDNTVAGAEDLKQEKENNKRDLSDEEVMELLEMTEDLDNLTDVEEGDFKELNQAAEGFEEKQVVGERHPLEKELRNAVLARDKFTCQCCGLNMGAGSRNGLIAVHHKLPVHVGGKDTMENLTTLCLNCHVSLHIMERNGGSIMMSKADFEALTSEEQISLRKILKLARVAVEADRRRGLTKEEIKKQTASSVRHIMPGEGLSENQEAYANYKRKQKSEKE